MANGLAADLHEFVITPQGTALMIAYDTVQPARGKVTQAVVQEVEIDTGLVLFEWHSVGHIATTESYRARPEADGRWDYIHPNSVAIDAGPTSSSPPARPTPSTGSRARPARALAPRRQALVLLVRPGRHVRAPARRPAPPDGTITIFDNSPTRRCASTRARSR